MYLHTLGYSLGDSTEKQTLHAIDGQGRRLSYCYDVQGCERRGDCQQLFLPGVAASVDRRGGRATFETSPAFNDGLRMCDVVVTNPPFSKLRTLMPLLADSGKQFLILGPVTAMNYKDVFELLKQGRLHAGHICDKKYYFERPDDVPMGVNITWYTNLPVPQRQAFVPKNGYTSDDLKRLGLWKVFDDRPDVLYIGKVADVPVDYYGLMAVPPSAFFRFLDGCWEFLEPDHFCSMHVDGIERFARIVVRRKRGA